MKSEIDMQYEAKFYNQIRHTEKRVLSVEAFGLTQNMMIINIAFGNKRNKRKLNR